MRNGCVPYAHKLGKGIDGPGLIDTCHIMTGWRTIGDLLALGGDEEEWDQRCDPPSDGGLSGLGHRVYTFPPAFPRRRGAAKAGDGDPRQGSQPQVMGVPGETLGHDGSQVWGLGSSRGRPVGLPPHAARFSEDTLPSAGGSVGSSSRGGAVAARTGNTLGGGMPDEDGAVSAPGSACPSPEPHLHLPLPLPPGLSCYSYIYDDQGYRQDAEDDAFELAYGLAHVAAAPPPTPRTGAHPRFLTMNLHRAVPEAAARRRNQARSNPNAVSGLGLVIHPSPGPWRLDAGAGEENEGVGLGGQGQGGRAAGLAPQGHRLALAWRQSPRPQVRAGGGLVVVRAWLRVWLGDGW